MLIASCEVKARVLFRLKMAIHGQDTFGYNSNASMYFVVRCICIVRIEDGPAGIGANCPNSREAQKRIAQVRRASETLFSFLYLFIRSSIKSPEDGSQARSQDFPLGRAWKQLIIWVTKYVRYRISFDSSPGGDGLEMLQTSLMRPHSTWIPKASVNLFGQARPYESLRHDQESKIVFGQVPTSAASYSRPSA